MAATAPTSSRLERPAGGAQPGHRRGAAEHRAGPTTRRSTAPSALARRRERSISFTWPAGAVGTGRFEFRVCTDVDGVVFESNVSDTGEANNSASADRGFGRRPDGAEPARRAGQHRRRRHADRRLDATSTRVSRPPPPAGPTGWWCATSTPARLLLNVALPYDISAARQRPRWRRARSAGAQLQLAVARGRARQRAASRSRCWPTRTSAGRAASRNTTPPAAAPRTTTARRWRSSPTPGPMSTCAPSPSARRSPAVAASRSASTGACATTAASAPAAAGSTASCSAATTSSAMPTTWCSPRWRAATLLDPGATYDQTARASTCRCSWTATSAWRVVADAAQRCSSPTPAPTTPRPCARWRCTTPGADLRVEVVDAPAYGARRRGRRRSPGACAMRATRVHQRRQLEGCDLPVGRRRARRGDTCWPSSARTGALAVGATYTTGARVFAPNDLTGSYRFIVRSRCRQRGLRAGAPTTTTTGQRSVAHGAGAGARGRPAGGGGQRARRRRAGRDPQPELDGGQRRRCRRGRHLDRPRLPVQPAARWPARCRSAAR